MNIRLLIAINDVLAEKGIALAIPASSRIASENAVAAQQALLDQAGKNTSSTGRPIPETYGAANRSATLAALGDGAKSAGGDGVEGGLLKLDDTKVQAQLVTYGITSLATLAELSIRVGVRYAQLVAQDRKAAAAAAAEGAE